MPENLSIFRFPVKAADLRCRDGSRIIPGSAFIPSPPQGEGSWANLMDSAVDYDFGKRLFD
jgi:hypothetical protein